MANAATNPLGLLLPLPSPLLVLPIIVAAAALLLLLLYYYYYLLPYLIYCHPILSFLLARTFFILLLTTRP